MTVKEHNSPSQIYNSGVPLDPKAPNVVAVKGIIKVCYQSSGEEGQVAIVGWANTADQVIPPMILFNAKNLNHTRIQKEVPGTKQGLSEKGQMTTDLF